VIEREGDESALGKGTSPGAGRLFLHARQGYDAASLIAL
jgi:hypothetical protein